MERLVITRTACTRRFRLTSLLDAEAADRKQVAVEARLAKVNPRAVYDVAPTVAHPPYPERAAARAVGKKQPGDAVLIERQPRRMNFIGGQPGIRHRQRQMLLPLKEFTYVA